MDTNGIWGGAGNSSSVECHKDYGTQNQSSLSPLILILFLFIFLLLESTPVSAGYTMPSGTPPSGVICVLSNGTSGNSAAKACFLQQTGFYALYDSYATNGLHIITSCPAGGGTVEIITTLRDSSREPYLIKMNMVCIGTPVCPGTVYNTLTGMCDQACPANSSGTAPACVCNAGFKFDAAGTSCVPVAVKCTIDDLPKFPLPTDDSCTKSLEKGAGKDVDKVCPPLDDRWTKPNGGQLQCLADKISKLGLSVPYTEPSATIRTVAYQNHLLTLWNKSQELKSLTNEEKLDCASLDSKVKSEMAIHGIDAQPSRKDSKAPHVLGKAIDIPKRVIKALKAKVNNSYYITPIPPFCLFCPVVPVYIGDVEDYVNSSLVNPPACKLRWGGRFDPYDPVHFQLP